MNLGMSQAAAAMETLEYWRDITTMNVASMQKPGHKEVIPAAYASVVNPDTKLQDKAPQGYLPECVAQSNFTPGSIQRTDVATHFSLEDPNCFFELVDEAGNKVYTRDGSFHFNQDNELVSASGHYKVSNSGSAPIVQVGNGYTISVSKNGKIQQGDQEIGTIGVFKLDPTTVEITPGGYKLKKAKEAPPAETFEVLQGALENSNVQAPQQMIRLIDIQHHYDANAESIKALDGALGKLIQNIYSS